MTHVSPHFTGANSFIIKSTCDWFNCSIFKNETRELRRVCMCVYTPMIYSGVCCYLGLIPGDVKVKVHSSMRRDKMSS